MRNESWNPLLKSYPDSDRINGVSMGAEVLYTRLIAQSDDAGRYYGEPRWVLARLFTARMIASQVCEQDIAGWLEELERAELIVRYQAEGGAFLELVNVKKCLRRDVKPEIRFPCRSECGTRSTQVRTASVTDSARARDESGTLDPEPYPDPEKTHAIAAPSAGESEFSEAVLPQASATPGRLADDTQAEGIYQAYPRHVGKPDAMRAIAKAIKLLGKRPEIGEGAAKWLLERTQAFAASPAGKAGQYCPHPATWFNGGRFDDDPTEWQAQAAITPSSQSSAATRPTTPNLPQGPETSWGRIGQLQAKLAAYPNHENAGQWRDDIERLKNATSPVLIRKVH